MKAFLKFIIFAAIIVVIVLIFSDSMGGDQAPDTTEDQAEDMVTDSQDQTPQDSGDNSEQTPQDDGGVEVDVEVEGDGSVVLGGDPNPGVTAITFRYTDQGFDFEEHTIKIGGSVFFTNITDMELDLASNPHPSHTGYQALNVGDIENGEFVEVSFTEVGEYEFHNHANVSQTGKVIVVEEF